MIIGAHAIVYSRDPEADRAFLREALGLPHVDVGGGWLIFGLPPAEVAVHPAEESGRHELYLMCDDVAAFVAEMAARDVVCGPISDQRWGLLTEVALPGGGKLGVYQPRHALAPQVGPKPAEKPTKKPTKKASRKPAKKPARKAKQSAAKRASKPKKRR